MTYDARQIANWFVQRAAQEAKPLSIMALLKLVYIAHGWNLEIQGQPLISNRIEAWQYGPVIPDVYRTFRPQGVSVTQPAPEFAPPTSERDTAFLEEIYGIYGHMSPFRLSELTHVEGGPWHMAREWGGWYAEIPNDLIHSHYVSKRQATNGANG